MRKGTQKMKIESQKMVERWVLIDCASTIFCIIWLKQHKFCSFYWSNSTAEVSEFQFFFFEGDISRVVTCLVSKISFYSSSVHGSSIFNFSMSWGRKVTSILRSSSRELGTPEVMVASVPFSASQEQNGVGKRRDANIAYFDKQSHRFLSNI